MWRNKFVVCCWLTFFESARFLNFASYTLFAYVCGYGAIPSHYHLNAVGESKRRWTRQVWNGLERGKWHFLFLKSLCLALWLHFWAEVPLGPDNASEIVQPWPLALTSITSHNSEIFEQHMFNMGTCASYTCVSFFNYQVKFKPCGGISFKGRWPRFWHGVSLPFFRCAWLVTMDVDLAPTPWLHPSIRSTVRMCARPVLALTSNVAGVLLVKVVHIRINGLVVVPQR